MGQYWWMQEDFDLLSNAGQLFNEDDVPQFEYINLHQQYGGNEA
jgi:hypothetical protein